MNGFYQVAILGPFYQFFTYQSNQKISIGTIVKVPFGKRSSLGVVLGESDFYPQAKFIEEVYEPLPQYYFLKWVSDFYHYPLGQLFKETLIKKRVHDCKPVKTKVLSLNEEQKTIVKKIEKNKFHKYYLYGPTGSGKTHTLLALAQSFLDQQVLYLTPEINLSETFALFFKQYLDPVFLFHSQLSKKKKEELAFRLQEEPTLVLGARSSIFLPFKKLSLIIVDEEHDGSYKQEERCRYQARDAAIKLAQMTNIPIVLASATPSLEQYEKFFKNSLPHHTLLTLSSRRELITKTSCVKEPSKEEFSYPFHEESLSLLRKAFSKKEQVLVFVNNVGFSTYLLCSKCSYPFYCPHCDLKLRYFKEKKILSCYHCHYQRIFEENCPKCENKNILHHGYGTEFILKKLEDLFPDQKFARFDKEELSSLKKFHHSLKDFEEGKIDVLVGTKLLSKGHNFKKVNSLIVLGLDRFFSFIDFRNHEKAFQEILQLMGRVGRFGEKSEVILQSSEQPDFLKNLSENKLFLIYDKLLEERKKTNYPPYSYLASLYFSHKNKKTLLDFFQQYHYAFLDPSIEILGPRPCLVEKKKNFYTWTYLVKAPSYQILQKYLQKIASKKFSLKIIIDLQPWQTL